MQTSKTAETKLKGLKAENTIGFFGGILLAWNNFRQNIKFSSRLLKEPSTKLMTYESVNQRTRSQYARRHPVS